MSKRVVYIWLIIVLIISLTFLFMGYNYKKNESVYDAKNKIKDAVYEYLKNTNELPNKGFTKEVSTDELISNEYLSDIYIEGNKCGGNIIISKSLFNYKYEFNITCANY